MSTLQEKLAQLRALKLRESPTPSSPSQSPIVLSESITSVLFLGSPAEEEYVPYLKGMFNGYKVWVYCGKIELLSHLEMYCAKRQVTRVVTTSIPILVKLLELQGNVKSNPSLSDYAGSLFDYRGLTIVFVPPIKQLHTVSYGRFICKRFISKVVDPDSWREATPFKWTIVEPSNIQGIYDEFSEAFAIAVDIETFRVNLAIRCVGYTGVFIASDGSIRTHSIVIPLDSAWALTWVRKFNALPAQKILQNGKYDCSYLLRYNVPLTNWQWDTAIGMHSWYSELPKDLAFQNAFFLRKVVYWKDLAETQDLHQYYKYNCLDTWATANVWITWILSAPDWAKRNYSLEFPLVFPCLLSEMTGLKRDMERLVTARKEVDTKEAILLSSLRKMLGSATFNPGSPKQVLELLKALGCGDIEGTGVKELAKARLRHPLYDRILGLISRKKEETGDSIRGLRKLASNYLRLDSDKEKGKDNGAKEFCGRILYALNPDGTDTGRLASREHHFWTGLQIQNIPRGFEVKQTIVAEDGFFFGESDLEQAESRDTAYISGDKALILAVGGTRDFHSVNASAFFGRSYESIYDDERKKTKDKALRDLAKRVNHGANYNMGPGVLVDTMGLDKIFEAARLLGLIERDPQKIAAHLLATFHRTYPAIKGKYYESVINEVELTSMLVSRAYHHTEWNLANYSPEEYIEKGDWTRYCFGHPKKNKLDLNSYVAHCPQSLNSRTLNEAYMRVFYNVALPNPDTFRLHAQIHDSVLFSYKQGFECHASKVRELMEIPVTVRDVSGTYRTFTVPAALKIGKNGKPAKYWSETE